MDNERIRYTRGLRRAPKIPNIYTDTQRSGEIGKKAPPHLRRRSQRPIPQREDYDLLEFFKKPASEICSEQCPECTYVIGNIRERGAGMYIFREENGSEEECDRFNLDEIPDQIAFLVPRHYTERNPDSALAQMRSRYPLTHIRPKGRIPNSRPDLSRKIRYGDLLMRQRKKSLEKQSGEPPQSETE